MGGDRSTSAMNSLNPDFWLVRTPGQLCRTYSMVDGPQCEHQQW